MQPFPFENLFHRLQKTLWLFLSISIACSPIMGQRRPAPRRAAPEPPAQNISFDTLLAADSYNIYGEVRSVGQLIRSEGLKDLVDPILKLAGPPKEFKSLVRWLDAHADALTSSRLCFAAWPSRPKLPQFLVAIEFASAEDAQKFQPQLKEFLPKLFPTPSPSPSSSPARNQPRAEGTDEKQNERPAAPSYILKQVGSLVFVSDVPFNLRDLKPPGSRLLAEDQNFRMIHDRFSSESIFVYVDLLEWEKEQQRRVAEQEKAWEEEKARQQKMETEVTTEPQVEASPEVSPEAESSTSNTFVIKEETRQTSGPDVMKMALGQIGGVFFGGQPKWPDAIGVALVFDGDSYVARVLLVNSADTKSINPVPFFPQFICGPALALEAPSIFPADTEFFVSASLDFPQIYDGMVKTAREQFEQMKRYRVQSVKEVEAGAEPPSSPFESYEKILGIKIKDDLLALLGNEIAFTLPINTFGAGAREPQPSPTQPDTDNSKQKENSPEGPNPIFAIAVKDRQAVRALLPRIIDSLGVKGASLLAQTEKQDDTEIVSYANVFAYAFIGNFLVLSPDVKSVRHVVDSYLSHDTLSSSTHFRNYTRWQPRQLLGQVYISPALMESYNSSAQQSGAQISDQLREYLMLMPPVAQPVTFAVSNEGLGPMHELHVPKSLLMMLIAGISSQPTQAPELQNEAIARSALHMIVSAEQAYQATTGAGRYGSMDELMKAGLISKDVLNHGYKVELTASANKFEVVATPNEYGKTGKLSFFIDETAVLRTGDHGGGPATVADKSER